MSDDVLSDLLSAVRLTGSVFFDVSATPPWVAEAPPAADIAKDVTPGAQHAIEYHVVTRGTCWISLVGRGHFEPVRLDEGDVVVMPHGDAHALSSAPGMRAEPIMDLFRRPDPGIALPFVLRTGVEGPVETHLVCGFFSCDKRPFNPLLDSLPDLMRVGRRETGQKDGLLEQFIRFAMAEASNKRPGGQSVLNKWSELMFVEVIRRHMERMATDHTGWLAGLRDPLVGRALGLLHARPAHAWSLDELAKQTGASRSALADRFCHLVGYPPIQYLSKWRMQLAAARLADPAAKVSAIAQEVGYESEAAFSRAFKKIVGRSPAEWRDNPY